MNEINWPRSPTAPAALHSLFLSLCWLRRFTRLASLALLAFRKEMEEKKKSYLISFIKDIPRLARLFLWLVAYGALRS